MRSTVLAPMPVGGVVWAFLVLVLPLALHFFPAALLGACAAMLLVGVVALARFAKMAGTNTRSGTRADNFSLRTAHQQWT